MSLSPLEECLFSWIQHSVARDEKDPRLLFGGACRQAMGGGSSKKKYEAAAESGSDQVPTTQEVQRGAENSGAASVPASMTPDVGKITGGSGEEESAPVLHGPVNQLVFHRMDTSKIDFSSEEGTSIGDAEAVDWNRYEKYTKAGAAKMIQCFVRRFIARKLLARKIHWHNTLAIELYAERQAAKYSEFYHHMFHGQVKKLSLDNFDEEAAVKADMATLAAIARKEDEGQATDAIREDGTFRDEQDRDLYFGLSGFTLVEHCEELMNKFDEGKRLHIDSAIAILTAFVAQMAEEASIMEITAGGRPGDTLAVVVGDLFGHYSDFCEIVKQNGLPSRSKVYVFNGNVINRGANSLECFFSILMLRLVFPESVAINRGNMEHAAFALVFGFVTDVTNQFSPWKLSTKYPQLLSLFEDAFKSFTLGVQLFGQGLVVHGGVWRDEGVTLDYIKSIRRFDNENVGLRHMNLVSNLQNIDLMSGSKEERDVAVMQDILWSNISDDVDRVTFNEKRGISICYDRVHVETVLRKNNLRFFCSSGMPLKQGYTLLEDREDSGMTMAGVFSASLYFGPSSNRAGYLLVDQSLGVRACSFETSAGKRDVHYDYISQIKGLVRENILGIQDGFERMAFSSTMKGAVSLLTWAQIMTEKTMLDIPWLLDKGNLLSWDMLGVDENEREMVNYEKFLGYYGLTEADEERRAAQGTLLKYARPLWIYFEEHQKLGSKLNKDVWIGICKRMSHYVHDPTLNKVAVIETMLSLLVENYCLKEEGPEASLRNLATGKFWKDSNAVLQKDAASFSKLPVLNRGASCAPTRTPTSDDEETARLDFIMGGGIDRSKIVRNNHGSEESNSINPELWNMDGTEIDHFAEYATGSHQWALQSKLFICVERGKDIPGYPINASAVRSGHAYMVPQLMEIRTHWKETGYL